MCAAVYNTDEPRQMRSSFNNFSTNLTERLRQAQENVKHHERRKPLVHNNTLSRSSDTNKIPKRKPTFNPPTSGVQTTSDPNQDRNSKNQPIPVYAKVKTMKNSLEELMRFMLRPTNSVSHLRRYLANKFKVHLRQVDLLFRNRVLLDHQLMKAIGLGSTGYLTVNIAGDPVEEDDTLTVLQDAQSFVSLQLRSISPKAITHFRLEEKYNEKVSLYDLKLPATFTAESLKMYLSDRLKFPTKCMKLTLKRSGQELEDKAQLRDELTENAVITLTRREPTSNKRG